MIWKEQLKNLEQHKKWDLAIELMQKIIAENPNNVDAYLGINYLLMNLLVEEDYNKDKRDYYMRLAKKYFDESYAKFSNNPEYLFYTGRTAVMSEWFFGIEVHDYEKMLHDAMTLEPNNLLYKWSYYDSLDFKNPNKKEEACTYAKIVLEENSPIKKLLSSKGSMGEYLLDLMINWSKQITKI